MQLAHKEDIVQITTLNAMPTQDAAVIRTFIQKTTSVCKVSQLVLAAHHANLGLQSLLLWCGLKVQSYTDTSCVTITAVVNLTYMYPSWSAFHGH